MSPDIQAMMEAGIDHTSTSRSARRAAARCRAQTARRQKQAGVEAYDAGVLVGLLVLITL
ncbi:hypothetical protein [Cereibacter changlensis]|uniref:hypothetical protein n=1 Tax=Cereibacter changlensis TaxID=402884 RepID=UPI0011B2039D|nr:hypothetical protein [Cereibacter changlensis]